MIKILAKYEFYIRNTVTYRYYMGSNDELESLVHLIKLIGCIIVFEVVRKNRHKMKSNLEDYRIPYDDEKVMVNHFSSLSYEARRAMELVVIYFKKNKDKKRIF